VRPAEVAPDDFSSSSSSSSALSALFCLLPRDEASFGGPFFLALETSAPSEPFLSASTFWKRSKVMPAWRAVAFIKKPYVLYVPEVNDVEQLVGDQKASGALCSHCV